MEAIERRSDVRSRFIDAPPAEVYAAIADPSRLARWWGPDGFTSTFHAFDFRPGGAWRLTMHAPDGQDHANESRFVRLVPGELFEIEHLSGHHFVLTVTLQPSGRGTQVHWQQSFDSVEHYERIARFVADANAQNLRRLETEVREAAGAVVREFWRLMAGNDFEAVKAVLAPELVVEWPQSGERLRGPDNFARMNTEYPATGRWQFSLQRLLACGNEVVTHVHVTDGTQTAEPISFFTVRAGKVVRLVEYWPEPFAAAENRRHLVEPIA